MTGIPQLIVSLAPSGELVCELPGFMATRRKVELRSGEVESTLKRILQHQLLGETEIGEDGAPTGAQVKHWEQHIEWPGAGCRFCIAEGRILVNGQRPKKFVTLYKRSDGVEVRRIPAKVSGLAKKVKRPRAMVIVAGTLKKTAEEMGL